MLSIFINWVFGLFPSLLIRYVIVRRPLSEGWAKVWTVLIFIFLFLTVAGAAHLLGVEPNLAPVIIWSIVSYGILKAEKANPNPENGA